MYCPLYFGLINRYGWPAKVTCITRPPSCGTIVTLTHELLNSSARQPSKFLDSTRQAGEVCVCAQVFAGMNVAQSIVATSEYARDGTKKCLAFATVIKMSAISQVCLYYGLLPISSINSKY